MADALASFVIGLFAVVSLLAWVVTSGSFMALIFEDRLGLGWHGRLPDRLVNWICGLIVVWALIVPLVAWALVHLFGWWW